MSRRSEPLTHGALFAGYDGIGLALESLFPGLELAWYSEFDPNPSRIMAHNYPGVPNFGDVRVIKWTPDCPDCGASAVVERDAFGVRYRCAVHGGFPLAIRMSDPDAASIPVPVRILTGGFPCQDVSLAGRRAGMRSGTRSGLWAEFAKGIAAMRPDLVVIENVRGLLSAEGEPQHEALALAEAEVARLDSLIHTAREFSRHNPARSRNGRSSYVRRWESAGVRLARRRRGAVARRDAERGLVQRAIAVVLRDLADLGFDAEWGGVEAAAVGAPHKRFRVFIVAWPSESDGALFREHAVHGLRGKPLAPSGAASALFPTPDASVANDGEGVETWSARRERVKAQGINGNGMGMPLTIAVQTLPTPRAMDYAATMGAPGAARHVEAGNGSLAEVIGAKLMPTPTTSDSNGIGEHGAGGLDLRTAMALLPTPDAYSGSRGGAQDPAKRRAGGHAVGLHDVAVKGLPTPTTSPDTGNGHARNLGAEARGLLPTPSASDGTGGRVSSEMGGVRDSGAKRSITLATAVHHQLLPTPSVADTQGGRKARSGERSDELLLNGIAAEERFGEYQAAVDRWEAVLARVAPDPTSPNPKSGKPQLSASFTEWMMGLPLGRVTDPAIWDGSGLSVPAIRNAQLKACGNGVVPQQAAFALSALLWRAYSSRPAWALAA